MNRIDQAAVADALLSAPGWARVGLTAPNTWMREDAARELARIVLGQMEQTPFPRTDQEQLPL